MQKAYQQAQLAYENGEVPIGALLVKDYEIVTSSYNQTLTLSDPTAHRDISYQKSSRNF